MHDEKIVQRFIELRASGWTYDRLMTELNVTKPTLIAWSRKHQFQIQNLKTIELEALGEKWLASITDRVNALGGTTPQGRGRDQSPGRGRPDHAPALCAGAQFAPPDRPGHRFVRVHGPRRRNPGR